MEDRVSGKGYEHLILQEEGGKCPGKGEGQGHLGLLASWMAASALLLWGLGDWPVTSPAAPGVRFQETVCQTATQLVLTPHRIPGVAVFYLKSPQG